ncbi:MAG: glycoside hydrolase family 15 protein, partial [Chthonomonadales bacterium]
MPRDIPVGNGRLLINFDNQYRIRDIYYPRVGGENHSSGHPYRFGVWIENQFSWVESDEWQRSMLYKEDTLVTEVVLKCDRLGVELHCEDTVDFHETIYLRQIKVINHADHPREVRLFFYHNFHISDFEVGDTAVWYPQLSALIHYKKMRYFLINGQNAEGQGISDYATGIKEMAGQEGTYRDAEDDGVLGKNPIAQGSVDSTAALQATVGPGDESIFHYWICFGTNYHEVEGLNDVVIAKTPTTLIERTTSYWKLWVKRQLKAHNLSDSITELYKRSLLIIRTQMDDGGAIIAANDTDITQFNRDTYSYMWPRDGALVAHALDLAGYPSLSRTFYEFCRPLLTQEGYFLHKYHSDGSAGSSWHPWLSNGHRQLPIQEDETALVIWALWEHFKIYGDVDEIKPLYRELIMRSGVFMADSLHPTSNLPISSYDLWEERHGIHAFTVGAVYAGII